MRLRIGQPDSRVVICTRRTSYVDDNVFDCKLQRFGVFECRVLDVPGCSTFSASIRSEEQELCAVWGVYVCIFGTHLYGKVCARGANLWTGRKIEERHTVGRRDTRTEH